MKQRSQNSDPKLKLIRKVDSERKTAYSYGGETHLAQKKPITLAPVPTLEKPDEED